MIGNSDIEADPAAVGLLSPGKKSVVSKFKPQLAAGICGIIALLLVLAVSLHGFHFRSSAAAATTVLHEKVASAANKTAAARKAQSMNLSNPDSALEKASGAAKEQGAHNLSNPDSALEKASGTAKEQGAHNLSNPDSALEKASGTAKKGAHNLSNPDSALGDASGTAKTGAHNLSNPDSALENASGTAKDKGAHTLSNSDNRTKKETKVKSPKKASGATKKKGASAKDVIKDKQHAGCAVKPAKEEVVEEEEEEDDDADAGPPIKQWGQCGGSNFDDPAKCDVGLKCMKEPIDGLPSFMQCKPDPMYKCQNAEGNKDMACWYKVTWDMEKGIHRMPEIYHGLTPESSFTEFQEQNFNYLPEKSKCPAPCAPGTCFEVLHNEGCDSYQEWACEEDDYSLAFDCCCKKHHPKERRTIREIQKKQLEKNVSGPTIFCIALMLPGSYEVDLLRAQFDRNIGIFDPNCDEWAVFSNESLSLDCESGDDDYYTTLMNGTLEAPTGGDFNSSLNTEVFERFWDALLQDGRAWDYDWVVKVDPDTLFFPDRVKQMLSSDSPPLNDPPPGGMYINNCFLGMHGPIEVFNKGALGNYKDGKDKCISGDPGDRGQEDVYLRDCFELLGVEKVDGFNILFESENACKEKPSTAGDNALPPCFAPEAAFHPFKNVESMMHCWAEAVSHEAVVDSMAPMSDPPSPENNRHG